MDLLGTYEVHLILGVERSRIARWLKEREEQGKTSIPEPVARLACGPIWRRAQIEKRLARMYVEAGEPFGEEGLRDWAWQRSLIRGDLAGVDEERLREIVDPLAAAERLAA